MTCKIVYRRSANADLANIYDWVAGQADAGTAIEYLRRIRGACEALASFPNRGTPRDDLSSGLKTVSFERRAVIAFTVSRDTVRIVRILHRGLDPGRAFTND